MRGDGQATMTAPRLTEGPLAVRPHRVIQGELSGASAPGVGLTSDTTLRAPATGRFKFADGKRRRFEVVTGDVADEPTRLREGQMRLIVLPGGEMSRAGAARGTRQWRGGVFVRSTKG
jgi:hypothetical protein